MALNIGTRLGPYEATAPIDGGTTAEAHGLDALTCSVVSVGTDAIR
jgi:hypothetical protein